MPMSRARTAICSAPLEWPSRPGLPTRIFIRRPSASPTRATSSRSSAMSSVGAGAAELGDLLRAVGVAVQARLADEDLHPAPERIADAGDLVAQLGHVLRRRGRG